MGFFQGQHGLDNAVESGGFHIHLRQSVRPREVREGGPRVQRIIILSGRDIDKCDTYVLAIISSHLVASPFKPGKRRRERKKKKKKPCNMSNLARLQPL